MKNLQQTHLKIVENKLIDLSMLTLLTFCFDVKPYIGVGHIILTTMMLRDSNYNRKITSLNYFQIINHNKKRAASEITLALMISVIF